MLKSYPDFDYLKFLQGLGFGLPAIHTVSEQHPDRTVTEDALTDAGATVGNLAGFLEAALGERE